MIISSGLKYLITIKGIFRGKINHKPSKLDPT